MYFRLKRQRKDAKVILQAVDRLWGGTVIEEFSVDFSSDTLPFYEEEFYSGAREMMLFIEEHLQVRLRTRD